jgi:hypothetical protein
MKVLIEQMREQVQNIEWKKVVFVDYVDYVDYVETTKYY